MVVMSKFCGKKITEVISASLLLKIYQEVIDVDCDKRIQYLTLLENAINYSIYNNEDYALECCLVWAVAYVVEHKNEGTQWTIDQVDGFPKKKDFIGIATQIAKKNNKSINSIGSVVSFLSYEPIRQLYANKKQLVCDNKNDVEKLTSLFEKLSDACLYEKETNEHIEKRIRLRLDEAYNGGIFCSNYSECQTLFLGYDEATIMNNKIIDMSAREQYDMVKWDKTCCCDDMVFIWGILFESFDSCNVGIHINNDILKTDSAHPQIVLLPSFFNIPTCYGILHNKQLLIPSSTTCESYLASVLIYLAKNTEEFEEIDLYLNGNLDNDCFLSQFL